MNFMRRPNIDTVARVHIATQAFLGLGVYGAITRTSQSYYVSCLFVYKLLWQLMLPQSPGLSGKRMSRRRGKRLTPRLPVSTAWLDEIPSPAQ